MKRRIAIRMLVALLLASCLPLDALAARRVVVRHRGPRTTVIVHRHFPLHRTLPRTVVVRHPRNVVVVGAPLVFLPTVIWTRAVVAPPPRERLVWQDSESFAREEDWVDCHFGVDGRGNALFVEVSGSAQINFADVTFANGEVQVVDFQNRSHPSGVYRLLDFADGRHVKTVRMVTRSKSPETTLRVYLKK
jgi:hypothetical protein